MYVSQEAETLAVHSLLTIQDTDVIKRNSRNVRKRRVFAQRVTYFWKTRSIPFWMTANVRIPFSDDPILHDRKSIILGIFYDPFSDDDKCILFYKKRIIQFWMTANVFQFWKTRIIQFWMTANIPFLEDKNHPMLDDSKCIPIVEDKNHSILDDCKCIPILKTRII